MPNPSMQPQPPMTAVDWQQAANTLATITDTLETLVRRLDAAPGGRRTADSIDAALPYLGRAARLAQRAATT